MGADNLVGFHLWRGDGGRSPRAVPIAVIDRPGATFRANGFARRAMLCAKHRLPASARGNAPSCKAAGLGFPPWSRVWGSPQPCCAAVLEQAAVLKRQMIGSLFCADCALTWNVFPLHGERTEPLTPTTPAKRRRNPASALPARGEAPSAPGGSFKWSCAALKIPRPRNWSPIDITGRSAFADPHGCWHPAGRNRHVGAIANRLLDDVKESGTGGARIEGLRALRLGSWSTSGDVGGPHFSDRKCAASTISRKRWLSPESGNRGPRLRHLPDRQETDSWRCGVALVAVGRMKAGRRGRPRAALCRAGQTRRAERRPLSLFGA